jgi:hypothetical protein
MADETLLRFTRELEERNCDNVGRTESYLELYAWTRAHPPELPWLFMAHLVSRNAGYMMTEIATRLPESPDPSFTRMAENLFLLLERGNFLIFHDAWHHVTRWLEGGASALTSPRTPTFMIEAWARYARAVVEQGATTAVERALVLDLVHNEQHFIENRVVHHADFVPGAGLLAMIEASGREKPLVFPVPEGEPRSEIRVGEFASRARRIATGQRIFDEVVADRARRDAMFAWATAHPHTGSRGVYGGRPGPGVREVWPLDRVRSLSASIHDAPEPDPTYP